MMSGLECYYFPFSISCQPKSQGHMMMMKNLKERNIFCTFFGQTKEYIMDLQRLCSNNRHLLHTSIPLILLWSYGLH